MKTSKKVLSVFLAVVMTVLSCAVCFTSFAAVNQTDLDDLVAALKCDAIKNISSRKSDAGDSYWFDRTFTLETYSDYVKVKEALRLLSVVITQTDEYAKGLNYSSDSKDRKCADPETLKDELANILSDKMGDDYSAYNVATFLGLVLHMEYARKHADANSTKSKTQGSIYYKTKVITNDIQGWLASDDFSMANDTVMLGVEYYIKLNRESYRDGWRDYYHNCFNFSGNNEKPIFGEYDIQNGKPDQPVNANTEIVPQLKEYAASFNKIKEDNKNVTFSDMLAMVEAGTMDAFLEPIVGAYNEGATAVGGEKVLNKVVPESADIKSFIDSCNSAKSLQEQLPKISAWNEFVENHPQYAEFTYGTIDAETVKADYITADALYTALMGVGEMTLKGLPDKIDYDAAVAYYEAFTQTNKAYAVADTYASAKALYEANKDKELEDELRESVYTQLTEYLGVLNACEDETILNAVIPDGYNEIVEYQATLYCEPNSYVVYFSEKVNKPVADMTTQEMFDVINNNAEMLTHLDEFYATIVEKWDDDTANAVLGELRAKAAALPEKMTEALAARFEVEVNYAYKMYVSINSTVITLKNYGAYRAAYSQLEDSIYVYFAANGKLDLLSDETKAEYEVLKAFRPTYDDFNSTYGLNTYEASEYDEYAVREEVRYPNDQVKTEDYAVTEENLNATISDLDKFLTSDDFSNLIGGKDISTVLNDLVGGLIYSDSFINTVVNLLYPLVYGAFSDIFVKNLPKTANLGTDLVSTLNIEYKKSMKTVLDEAGLPIHPQLLAAAISDDYADVKATLALAEGDTYASNPDVVNPWKNESLFTDGKLNLVWGVDSAENKEEAFYKAFAEAMKGLEPLIDALLCDSAWTANDVGGLAYVTGTAVSVIPVNATAKLHLSTSANDGYVNALAPIFEAFGLSEKVRTSAQMKEYAQEETLENVARAIIEPIFELVDKVANAPVDTVLSILPNALYALSANMIPAILSMLKLDVNYTADAKVYNAFNLSDAIKGSEKINVGNMLDLSSIKINDWPLDLTNINGLIKAIGIELPEIDTISVATMGKLTTKDTVRKDWTYAHTGKWYQDGDNWYETPVSADVQAVIDAGKAYTIEANKADLAYYVLTYLVDLIQDEDALNALLDSIFALLKKDATDVKNTVSDVIAALDIKNTGDVIAAAVELLNAEKYPQDTFTWPEAAEGEEVADKEQVVVYSEYWTKEKAKYVSENLVPLVTGVASLLGYDLDDVVTDLLSSLYTRDNLVKLVDLVNGYISKLTDNGTIAAVIDIVGKMITVNGEAYDVSAVLNHLSTYEAPAFKDGDRDAFVKALVDYILPVVPVVKLLLVDSDDNSTLGLADVVDVFGYNGYDNALIPVLEALGCQPDDITDYAEFVALDDEAAVYAVLNPILNLIDYIAKDPVNNIIGILPNILYFIDTGRLQMAIDNLLEPVYVVLDVIRPIKNVDLVINLNLDEIITDLLAKIGIKSLSYAELSNTVKMLGTVKVYKSANGDENAVYLYVEDSLTPDFITVLLRSLIKTLLFADNIDNYIEKLREKGEYTEEELARLSDTLHKFAEIGSPDQILYVLYYVFYGVNTGYEGIEEIRDLISDEMANAIESMTFLDKEGFDQIVDAASKLLEAIRKDLENGAENGGSESLSFFAKIAAFFQRIFDWFFHIFVK